MMEVHVCNRVGQMLRAFALGDSDELIVGRDESCDIRIESKNVSREHCAIERNGEGLVLRDLGSSGGTYCNGRRIQQVPLQDGTEVTVGPALLRFHETII